MRLTSATVMIIFSKVPSESYLITTIFKVLSKQLRDTLTKTFWKTPTVEDFTDMDQDTS